MLLNMAFIGIWIIRRQWLFLFSAVLFLIGLPFMHRFVQFSKSKPAPKDHLSVMSFNVRLFNHYKWSEDSELRDKIIDFITQEHPNIIALQEFYTKESGSFPFYKYKKFIYKKYLREFGFSKTENPTEEEIQPDDIYQMHGNQITVKILDLNQKFDIIAKQLDDIVKNHFDI